jgi:adhesin transport system outer membrane protein
VRAAWESTALRTAEVYLEVLRRRDLARLARENLATHERIHGLIAQRTESGLGRSADLDQSESRVALARSNLVVEEANLLDAETNYLRVVGGLPDDPMPRPSPPQRLLPASLDQATAQAVAEHPTLKSAEADVQAAVAQHEAAKHAYYPRFDLELGRSWNDNLDGLEGYDNDGQLMVRMRYNLYNGGADQARVAETAHLINEAKEIRDRAHRQVVESIRLSWNALEANDQRLRPLRRHQQASEATRNAYRKQFDLGERTLLDLLDSENELFEARRAAANTEYDGVFSRYRVLAGMARLVEGLGVEPPSEAQPLAGE